MEQPTEEQIKTFWKRIGFTLKEDDRTWTEWRDSNDELVCCGHIGANPPIDLNHLFKYAIPKLQSEGYQIEIFCLEHEGFNVLIRNVIHDFGKEAVCSDEDLTLALFGAIWDVIK